MMHKWKTNDANMKKLILESETQNGDEEEVKTYSDTMLGDVKQKNDKVLGISWNQQTNSFKISFQEIVKCGEDLEVTRRNVLSILSSLFNPLGSISWALVVSRVLFPKICLEQKDWDKVVSAELIRRWKHSYKI